MAEEPASKKAKVSPDKDHEEEKKEEEATTSGEDESEFVGVGYEGSDYTGLVVSCIRFRSISGEKEEEDGDGDLVEFAENDGRGEEAVFLANLREVKGRRSVRRYRATRLTAEAARAMIRDPPRPPGAKMEEERWRGSFRRDTIPLVSVHGFDVGPSDLFDLMEKRNRYANRDRCVQEVFADRGGGRLYPVPVLWPLSYFGWVTHRMPDVGGDRNVVEAEEVFQILATALEATFPRKSLMVHGSGCARILNALMSSTGPGPPREEKVSFEDIFLVAADVDFDVLHAQPDESQGHSSGGKTRSARRLFSMLRTKETSEGDGSDDDDDESDDANAATDSSNDNSSGEKDAPRRRRRPAGELHVLHNVSDVALLLGRPGAAFFVNRLGQRGAGMYTIGRTGHHHPDSWRGDRRSEMLLEELAPHCASVDCSECSRERLYDDKLHHEYQLDDFAVAYYSDPEAHRIVGEHPGSYRIAG